MWMWAPFISRREDGLPLFGPVIRRVGARCGSEETRREREVCSCAAQHGAADALASAPFVQGSCASPGCHARREDTMFAHVKTSRESGAPAARSYRAR